MKWRRPLQYKKKCDLQVMELVRELDSALKSSDGRN